MPGDEACMISGLNCETADIILGLSASDRGTFWYHGKGKLKRELAVITLKINWFVVQSEETHY